MKSYLRIERLILVGSRKNYSVEFNDGLNIIHGDSDTGKSSILEFIDYLLGGSSIELADEIISSVDYAVLEIVINDEKYTIIRNIFKPNELIEVYNCKFDDVGSYIPKKYAPKFNITSAPDGFFSDFLMDSLNFPKLKLKVSPSQEISRFRRISFRDIIKFCYVDQDNMGSKSLLGLTEWARYAHTKEVFKYIFNLFDADISDIESQISEKTTEFNRLVKKYENVSEFLRDTGYESIASLDMEIDKCDLTIEGLEEKLSDLNGSMKADSEIYNELKAYHSEFNLKIKGLLKKIADVSYKREQYIRLKNDYKNDINKIQAIHTANSKIGQLTNVKCNCPICDNIITISNDDSVFLNSKTEKLDEELNSLLRRVKSIDELIVDLATEGQYLTQERSVLEDDLAKVAEMIDTETKEMITPFLTQRDALVKELADIRNRRGNLVSNLRVRNHQDDILTLQAKLKENLSKLNEQLDRLKKDAPDISGILSSLGDYLNDFLAKINIKNRTGISISPSTYSAIVRNRDYFNITSGGLRTLISMGYVSSLLKYSIVNDINHPRFLLLDTVGKYLGKSTKYKYMSETDSTEDLKEGTSDPQKYEKIFNNLIDISNYAQQKSTPCQIIVVDNDVPEKLAGRLKSITVAQFSSTGDNNLPPGLIDDIIYV
ncbi:AAA family ATPase [Pectobacterium aroidearum]|uniref:AAA family ATPase n=1 Tax=Pectobacterium aroidearum TaxID=1201031 RepID=UPI003307A8F3